ncbi:hypothetical protein PF005_g1673 [Phytophthora fragariae]|uniref:Uncharacterized protein n=1 Tax=Phytophthora fragariae TaxID=53985 RepID=A0A6A4AGV2_9STRA|nr:hypothetical protein PF003_g35132 [Phytophthora fragariae]KAE8948727.1 hypothetical protein PF009_g1727 [Phytophthora fragariae]KAE9008050.1 hypothetical protein PF011_g10864 [Phytophthora fragariae]KAE9105910.1 hypothetical protein PF007_g13602 [Phytophthora fragariae]KAE9138367.1 hypothetical protein PF010_g1004 [Phytophthora fragariae]
MAAMCNHLKALRILVDAGANVDLEDFCGWTALSMAYFSGYPQPIRDFAVEPELNCKWTLSLIDSKVWKKRKWVTKYWKCCRLTQSY